MTEGVGSSSPYIFSEGKVDGNHSTQTLDNDSWHGFGALYLLSMLLTFPPVGDLF